MLKKSETKYKVLLVLCFICLNLLPNPAVVNRCLPIASAQSNSSISGNDSPLPVSSNASVTKLTPNQLATSSGHLVGADFVPPTGSPAIAPTGMGNKLQGEVKQSQTDTTDFGELSTVSTMPKNYIRGSINLGNLSGAQDDPDAQDKELSIAWDRWRNRFLQAVLTSTTELLNSDQARSFQFNPTTNAIESKYPLGTTAWFVCTITNDRQIKNPRIVRSSGFSDYDQAVIEAVNAMADSRILKFPSASKRVTVLQGGGIERSAQLEQQYFHFGDVEHRRLPAY